MIDGLGRFLFTYLIYKSYFAEFVRQTFDFSCIDINKNPQDSQNTCISTFHNSLRILCI